MNSVSSRPLQICQLLKNAAAEDSVYAFGWIKSRRTSKACSFVIINDGSMQNDLQVVVDSNSAAHLSLGEANTGAALKIKGIWKSSPGKGQSWEIHATEIVLEGLADPETYPLQKKGHTLEYLREIGHLRPRTNTFGAVFRIRNTLSQLVHRFFQERGFSWIHTPILTASDCEGAGEMFRVTTMDLAKMPRDKAGQLDFSGDFFGKAAHLTVSGQLEGEAFAQSMRDIYTFGPTFRAENSNTSRHLAEFWMIEPEMAFANLNDDMNLAEDFLKYIFIGVANAHPSELDFLAQHYKNTSVESLILLGSQAFARITYTEAVKILEDSGSTFEFPVRWGIDLQSEHERFLTDQVFKGPVIVTNYPKDIKAFYMRSNDDDKTVAAMDVLVPRVGEIIGGSQREERLDRLEQRLSQMNIPTADLWWYLDLRRYGSTQHCGFGAGFERLVQYVTGMTNIRDVIPFPRHPGNISF